MSPKFVSKNIEYIGSPYRTRFGDTFDGRLIGLYADGTTWQLKFPGITKHLIEIRNLEDLQKEEAFDEGDQVKVRVKLKRSEYALWPELRRSIKNLAVERGWELYGPDLVAFPTSPSASSAIASASIVEPSAIFEAYGMKHKLTAETLNFGLSILKEVTQA